MERVSERDGRVSWQLGDILLYRLSSTGGLTDVVAAPLRLRLRSVKSKMKLGMMICNGREDGSGSQPWLQYRAVLQSRRDDAMIKRKLQPPTPRGARAHDGTKPEDRSHHATGLLAHRLELPGGMQSDTGLSALGRCRAPRRDRLPNGRQEFNLGPSESRAAVG